MNEPAKSEETGTGKAARNGVRIGNNHVRLPGSRIARIIIGCLLIVMGFLGFLPILGFWMIPLGLLVLSVDIPAVRRFRRQVTVRLFRRYPKLGKLFGQPD